jgi:ATP synthase protein I
MNDQPQTPDPKGQSTLEREVGAKAARKLRARRNPTQGIWSGLGTMGLIGWSVAVPTLLGAAIGLWLDNVRFGSRSWTLALLVAGLCLGCLNAWRWVSKEDKEMHKEWHDDD